MRRKLELAPTAFGDLLNARAWLRQLGAGERARRRLIAIDTALRDLAVHPCRWPRGEAPATRERTIEGYRIVYEVFPDTDDDRSAGEIRVLRLFGPGQDRRGGDR
ncbi:MAG: type II toxin-antitoxin system RelE/ParE family toxin [Caulobacteraceae bacterium]